MDVTSWLARYGERNPQGPGYVWDFDAVVPLHDARELATALMKASTAAGKPALLALDAIRYAVWRQAQLADDATSAPPRMDGGRAWLDAFTDAVVAVPAFIGAAALAFNPPVPLGEQHYLDRRSDAYLAKHRASGPDRVEQVAEVLLGDPARTSADAERLWWCIAGGSAGIASQLVRAALRTRKRGVVELRRHLVAGVHDALIAGLPFWPRARLVEHVAREDQPLLADLLAHEQEPWLAAQMKYELAQRA